MVLRTREDQRVRGRAQARIGGIQLVAGRALAVIAEIADQLVLADPSKMKRARGSKLPGMRR